MTEEVALYRGSVEIIVFGTPQNGGIYGDKMLTVTNRRWGGFSMPGGKLHMGEDPADAARRELLEETGCEAQSLQRSGGMIHYSQPKDKGPPWFCLAYIAQIGDQRPRQVEEGTTPSWKHWTEIRDEGIYPDYYKWLFERLLADKNVSVW